MTAETALPVVVHMSTRELMTRLQRHYIKPGDELPGGVFVPECGWNGRGGRRRCDALYVGFTSTSGRILIGHEVKVSRADWRHELEQAGKADDWHDQCHAWYVVAPATDIVPPEEVPAGWGLMVVNPRSKVRLDVKVRATVHKRTPNWDTVRSIMARTDTLRAAEIGQIRRTALDQAREALAKDGSRDRVEQRIDESTRLRLRILERLEENLGMTLSAWGDTDTEVAPETAARLLRIARDETTILGLRPERWAIDNARLSGERLVAAIDSYREALRELDQAGDVRGHG